MFTPVENPILNVSGALLQALYSVHQQALYTVRDGKMSPAIAWLVLSIIVILFVVGYDLSAYLTHTETMSGQFHDWLFSKYVGPFIAGIWAGIFVGLTYHWFQIK